MSRFAEDAAARIVRSLSASFKKKLTIVDATSALVTSANLSLTAANDSLEAGVIIRGGSVPPQLAAHFTRLREREDLVECVRFAG